MLKARTASEQAAVEQVLQQVKQVVLLEVVVVELVVTHLLLELVRQTLAVAVAVDLMELTNQVLMVVLVL